MTTTSPSRFQLGFAAWVMIVAVLLVVLAAMAIYFGWAIAHQWSASGIGVALTEAAS